MKSDSFAWAIEGLLPVIIPIFLFVVIGHAGIHFLIGLSGTIAFTQLFSSIIKATDSLPGIAVLFRIDNKLRFFILFLIVTKLSIEGNIYLFFWLIFNIFLLIGIGKLFFLGRFRYTFVSFYSRILNFIFLLSFTQFAELNSYIRLINPFSNLPLI